MICTRFHLTILALERVAAAARRILSFFESRFEQDRCMPNYDWRRDRKQGVVHHTGYNQDYDEGLVAIRCGSTYLDVPALALGTTVAGLLVTPARLVE